MTNLNQIPDDLTENLFLGPFFPDFPLGITQASLSNTSKLHGPKHYTLIKM